MKKLITVLLILSAVLSVLPAGNRVDEKEMWLRGFTDAEKTVIDKYNLDGSEVKDHATARNILSDLADVYFYGAMVGSVSDRAGSYYAAFAEPEKLTEIREAYYLALEYENIAKRFGITDDAYNAWVYESMWGDALENRNVLEIPMELGLYTSYSMSLYGAAEAELFRDPLYGFDYKIKKMQEDVGADWSHITTDLALDVVSYGNHVIGLMDFPIISRDYFRLYLDDRLRMDLWVMANNKIAVTPDQQAKIDALQRNLPAIADSIYDEKTFASTYTERYSQSVYKVEKKYGDMRDWNGGAGVIGGWGFNGVSVAGYLGNNDILFNAGALLELDDAKKLTYSVTFDLSHSYNFSIGKGNYLGVGYKILGSYDMSNFTWGKDDAETEGDKAKDFFDGTWIAASIPVSYKFIFPKAPVMLFARADLGMRLEMPFKEFKNDASFYWGVNAGIQYLW